MIRGAIAFGLVLKIDNTVASKNVIVTTTLTLVATTTVLGKIAAGKPIEAIENAQELNLTELFAGPNRFVLQVTGDSMIEAGIHDSDYVIVRQTHVANNGDIVVALIDQQDVTLKRFYTISDNRIRLIPENSAMEPINYSPDRIWIQGVVIGQMRKY